MAHSGIHAVLTGDIIDSTRLSAQELRQAREVMAEAIGAFERDRPRSVRGDLDFFRGDAWQVLLERPGQALRLALLLRARLRAALGADTRVAIGIGGVDAVVEDRISMSGGEAFTLSGRALDRLSGYFDLTGALPDRAGPMADWLPAILHLVSGLGRSWTRRQAQLVGQGLLLETPTQERIAASLHPRVAKQTVQGALKSAGWRPLIDAVQTFERTDWTALLAKKDRPDALP